MRAVLWILLGIVGLLTPIVVFPRTTPGWISGEQIFAAFAIWPCSIVAFIGLGSGLFRLADASSRHSAIGMIILSLVMPSAIVYRLISFQLAYDAEYAWFDQVGGPGRLNFYLHEYVSKHPDRVAFPSPDSEEVIVGGFLDYLRSRASLKMPDHSGRVRKMTIKNDGIYTMWGAKIHFAVDRNQDGYIIADGQKGSTLYGYANPYTDRSDYRPGFASAVFISLPDRVLRNTESSLITLDADTYERLAPIVLKDR